MHRTKKHDTRGRRDIWMIAVVAIVATAAISGSCLFGTATNTCANTGRRCDPGQTCAAKQDICIDIGGCGDGLVERDKGEVCDDGNIIDGDGCSANCRSDETCGNGITDTIDPNHPKETCDDGNRISGDGCSADCFTETCGDGRYNPMNNEECDTAGNTQACNANCTIPRCGDGYVNTQFKPFGSVAPEQCEDSEPDPADPTKTVDDTQRCNGNNQGKEGPGSCRFPACGDRYLNRRFVPGDAGMFEGCDNGSADTAGCNGNLPGDQMHPNNLNVQCQIPRCGDGYTNRQFIPSDAGLPDAGLPEQCDEIDDTGNSKDSPNCNGNNPDAGTHLNNLSAQCQAPKCGDGYINNTFIPPNANMPEECDNGSSENRPDCNGNNNENNGPGSCRKPSCGDGYVNDQFHPPNAPTNINEQCDNGPSNNNDTADGCRTDCRRAFCGDGVIDTGESCDPGGNYGKGATGCISPHQCIPTGNNKCTCT